MNLGKMRGWGERERVDEILPFILIRHCWFTGPVKHSGAPGVEWGFAAGLQPPSPKAKLKKYRVFKHDDSKGFT